MITLFSVSCDLLNIKEQQDKAASFCQIKGSVNSELPNNGALIVVLLRHKGGLVNDKHNWGLVDHFVLDKPGKWAFYSRPGNYFLTAFQDINNNTVFERDEPAIPFDSSQQFTCTPKSNKAQINLIIPQQGRIPGNAPIDISNLQVRTKTEQLNVSLGQALAVGEILSLEDSRFSHKNAHMGLWRPFDFIWESKPGVYFLKKYDPNKIPVLFVHGISGTPIEFNFLINNLDQTRYQPWVVYYPSGSKLKTIVNNINRTLSQLKAEYHFKNLILVAHSMGGLVARNMILEQSETEQKKLYTLFISISTPWNGHKAAANAKNLPNPLYSWVDMAPSSEFLTQLFYTESLNRHLPPYTAHHLIFTYLTGQADDGTVSIESQLRSEAQGDARHLYGFLQSHTGILKDKRTSLLLNRLLLEVNY